MLLSSFVNQYFAENFVHYLTLKLPRFLLKQTLTSMNIAKDNFIFVPSLDFSRKWTDEELYRLYNLSQDEIDYIESIMRPMNIDNNIN
jgi:site-specific DNA-methyltransferase (adenine-specific)